MNRRTYAKNLQKQIKVRIDEVTFNKITELSEKTGKTKSLFLRDLISNGLRKLYKDQ
jgi:predicted DNA-binding protein